MNIAEFAKIWATDAEKKMMLGILFGCGILMTNVQNNQRLAMQRCVSLSVSSFGIKGTVCLKILYFVDFQPFS